MSAEWPEGVPEVSIPSKGAHYCPGVTSIERRVPCAGISFEVPTS